MMATCPPWLHAGRNEVGDGLGRARSIDADVELARGAIGRHRRQVASYRISLERSAPTQPCPSCGALVRSALLDLVASTLGSVTRCGLGGDLVPNLADGLRRSLQRRLPSRTTIVLGEYAERAVNSLMAFGYTEQQAHAMIRDAIRGSISTAVPMQEAIQNTVDAAADVPREDE